MFCENYEALVSALEGRGFLVHSAERGEQAKEIVLDLVKSGSVGCGGSMTVNGLGIPAALRERGNPVYFHWDEKPEDRPETFKKAAAADWYLCSVNALTRDAKLLNTDGNGNRVAALFNGPKKVALVVGKNKLVDDLAAGYERIKTVACVQNARRFQLSTPCALTGKCTDCHSPDRLCKVTVLIEAKPKFVDEMHIILVDEALGY